MVIVTSRACVILKSPEMAICILVSKGQCVSFPACRVKMFASYEFFAVFSAPERRRLSFLRMAAYRSDQFKSEAQTSCIYFVIATNLTKQDQQCFFLVRLGAGWLNLNVWCKS